MRNALPHGRATAPTLEIKANAQTNLARAEGARGHEKRVEECLPLRRRRGRSEGVEVDEFAAEAEDRFVQHIVKLHYRTKPQMFTQAKLTRDIQIKEKLPRSLAGVTRQVSGLADSGPRKEI